LFNIYLMPSLRHIWRESSDSCLFMLFCK